MGLNRMRTHPNRLTKEELEYLYWKEEINTPEIAENIGVSKRSILNWMIEYDIPRRNKSESLSLTMKKRWQEPEYRATMIGYLREYWNRSEERSVNSKKLWKNPDFRTNMSQIQKDVWKRPDHIAKMFKVRKRMWQNPEYRLKISEARKRTWSDIEYKNRVISKSRKSLVERPTKPEQTVIDLINKFNFPFRYVGDGEVMIDGLNPDFIHVNSEKKVIEVFGRVFHDPEKSFFEIPWKQQYWGKKRGYDKRGYDCLILWGDEHIDDMLKKIRRFVNG